MQETPRIPPDRIESGRCDLTVEAEGRSGVCLFLSLSLSLTFDLTAGKFSKT